MTHDELHHQVGHRVTGTLFERVDKDLQPMLGPDPDPGQAVTQRITGLVSTQVARRANNRVSDSIRLHLTGNTW